MLKVQLISCTEARASKGTKMKHIGNLNNDERLFCWKASLSENKKLMTRIFFSQYKDLFGPFNFTFVNIKKRPAVTLDVSYNLGSCILTREFAVFQCMLINFNITTSTTGYINKNDMYMMKINYWIPPKKTFDQGQKNDDVTWVETNNLYTTNFVNLKSNLNLESNKGHTLLKSVFPSNNVK